jgi:N-acetylglucosaminyl-diphospho-decaprenol L-rhamnosyltransferase
MNSERRSVPDVSFAFVCRNDTGLLLDCLDSLKTTVRAHSYETIVVDNGSSDGTQPRISGAFPDVTVLESPTNVGFSRGNNWAIGTSRGRYVALMNCDTLAHPGAIDHLVEYMDANPAVGVAAPGLLNRDLTDQGTARAFPTAAAAIFGRRSLMTRLFPNNRWSRSYMTGRHVRGDGPFPVDWVSAACMVVRRSVIDEVGGLDQDTLPMYWVDADWCYQIKRAGHAIMCVPKSRVVHFEQGGRGCRASAVWNFHTGAYRYYVKNKAPQFWNPLRAAAWLGLPARAVVIILGNELARRARTLAPRMLPARSGEG